MKLRLERLGPSMTVLRFGDIAVLFSYETAVAAKFSKEKLCYRTDKYISRTTEGHIKKWVADNKVETIEHGIIASWLEVEAV